MFLDNQRSNCYFMIRETMVYLDLLYQNGKKYKYVTTKIQGKRQGKD